MAAQKGKERTEIWEGIENISKKSWQVLSGARERSDYCHDSKSASFLVGNERYFQMIKQLQARGIKQRFVTEVTKENIQSCKELNKYMVLQPTFLICNLQYNLSTVTSNHLLTNSNIFLKRSGQKPYRLNTKLKKLRKEFLLKRAKS
jgi:hypothetical protein